ncbi:MAG: hypothetical protein RQ723_05545 [Desulfuromonadales bacterium]|nr:hypothetical protein [Desulfuromonadales bacterium]
MSTKQTGKMPAPQHDAILRLLAIILSLLTSFALVFYGLNLINSPHAGLHLSTFAYVTIAYGLGNVAILSLAWNSRIAAALPVHRLIAFCYFGIFAFDRFKGGFTSGRDLLILLVLAAVLYSNGVAVQKVIERPDKAG